MTERVKRATARGVTAALALSLFACARGSEGPPEIVLDRTACSHCRMLVSEIAFAGAYQAGGDEPRAFDDLACLLEGLGREESGAEIRVWVHDFESQQWIDASRASFVLAAGVETPMGGGILAFSDPGAAARVAIERGGRIVGSFEALRRQIVGEETS